jgi:hypothetical protein
LAGACEREAVREAVSYTKPFTQELRNAPATRHHAKYPTYRHFQLLVDQVVAELLQRLEGLQRQKRLGALNFVECEYKRAAATVDEVQEGSWHGTRLRGCNCENCMKWERVWRRTDF